MDENWIKNENINWEKFRIFDQNHVEGQEIQESKEDEAPLLTQAVELKPDDEFDENPLFSFG